MKKITVDQSKVLKIDCIDCSVFIGPPGIHVYIFYIEGILQITMNKRRFNLNCDNTSEISRHWRHITSHHIIRRDFSIWRRRIYSRRWQCTPTFVLQGIHLSPPGIKFHVWTLRRCLKTIYIWDIFHDGCNQRELPSIMKGKNSPHYRC